MVRNTTIHHFQIAATTSASLPTLDRLDRPIVTTTASARVCTSGTPLPLNVVGIAATTAAENVRTPVASTLRSGSFSHFS